MIIDEIRELKDKVDSLNNFIQKEEELQYLYSYGHIDSELYKSKVTGLREVQKEYLERIARYAESMIHQVDEVDELELELLQREPVEIGDFLEEVLEMLSDE